MTGVQWGWYVTAYTIGITGVVIMTIGRRHGHDFLDARLGWCGYTFGIVTMMFCLCVPFAGVLGAFGVLAYGTVAGTVMSIPALIGMRRDRHRKVKR